MKNAVSFIGRYEALLAAEAARAGVDGIVCGHIHHAADQQIAGLRYLNTGDWVESCTAVVEHYDGRMELVRFAERSVTRLHDRTEAIAAETVRPARKRAVA